MISPRVTRFVAAGAAAASVATFGLAIARSGFSSGSGTATAAQSTAPTLTGTIVTGAAADKAKAAALAANYKGTVNGVLKLSDGSYVVDLVETSGVHYVLVSKDFKVTGSV